jgi:hypothetical protein
MIAVRVCWRLSSHPSLDIGILVGIRAYNHKLWLYVYIASDASLEPSQLKSHGAYACRDLLDKNVL